MLRTKRYSTGLLLASAVFAVQFLAVAPATAGGHKHATVKAAKAPKKVKKVKAPKQHVKRSGRPGSQPMPVVYTSPPGAKQPPAHVTIIDTPVFSGTAGPSAPGGNSSPPGHPGNPFETGNPGPGNGPPVFGGDHGGSLPSGPSSPPSMKGAVPEPALWTMMIAGFGMIGASLRKKRRVAIA